MGRRKSADSSSSSDSDYSHKKGRKTRKREDKHNRHRLEGHSDRSAFAAAQASTSQFPSNPHATHTTSGFPSGTGYGGEHDHQTIHRTEGRNDRGGIISSLVAAVASSSQFTSDPRSTNTTSGFPSRTGYGGEYDHQNTHGARGRSSDRGGLISSLVAAVASSSRNSSDPHAANTTSSFPSHTRFGDERDYQHIHGAGGRGDRGGIISAFAAAVAPSSRFPSDPHAAHATSGFPSRTGFGAAHDYQSGHGGRGRHDRGGLISSLVAAVASSSQFTSDPHSANTTSGYPSSKGLRSEDYSQNLSGMGDVGPPPSYSLDAPPPPASGHRIPLATDQPLPANLNIGPPPFHDADGLSPIYIGSALMQHSIQPCTIGPDLRPYGYHGRYDLLPFRPHEMEWVQTSHGHIPNGRRPVEGGYAEKGAKLYHAAALFSGLRVPGMAGEHLRGARISFGGREYEVSDNYELLQVPIFNPITSCAED